MNVIAWFVDSYLQRNKTLLIVILAVLLVRLFMKKLPKKYVYCLWAIVGIRMLFSFQIPSYVSIYQFFPWAEPRSFSYESAREEDGSPKGGLTNDLIQESLSSDAAWPGERQETSETKAVIKGQEENAFGSEGKGQEEIAPGSEAIGREEIASEIEGKGQEENTAASEAQEQEVTVAAKDLFYGIFFGVWLAGVAAVLGIGMFSFVRVRRLVREAVLESGNLWECDGITTPFVLGIFRPRIYVPFHLDDVRKAFVLEHERQHVRRGDPFARLLAYVLLAVYWMNPLVWLSYFCFIRDQEMSCDEAVLSRLGADRKKEYGKTLISFATEERFLGFSPVGFGESDAEKRIKNILNYKKPSFWILILGFLIVAGIGVVCLTTAINKSKEPEDNAGSRASQDLDQGGSDTNVAQSISLQKTRSFLADVDGDGKREEIGITDHNKETTIQVTLKDGTSKEISFSGVDLIQTKGEAADLDGDGRDEILLLQSSPLGSTYNWPGKVLVFQLRDGEWRQLSDELFYPEEGEYVYQEYCPKHVSDNICIGVRIETMPDGIRLNLLYGMAQMAAHGREGVLRLDCTYQAEPEEGWQVRYIYMGHDYPSNVSLLQSKYHEIYGITLGEEPTETSDVEVSLANKLFFSVPLQYFERNVEADGLGSSLSVSENGSFMGTDVKSGKDLIHTEICEFTGAFTNARRVNGKLYLLTVDGLTYPDENHSYKQGTEQYVTMKPAGIAEGDRFLLYVPGYPVAELPYKVIRALEDQGMPNWYNYALEELPCHVLLNLDQGTIYLSGYSNDYVGQRMETVGLYGELSYPCGADGGISFKSVTRLCADACGLFVQKVTYPFAASQSFTAVVRNEQLAEYLGYKTAHFPHRFSEGASWLLELKTWDEVTVGGKRVLHVTGIPKYKNGSSKGSWGTIHFLIDTENGQHYIRDWYWDNPDSLDLSWRGAYSAEESYDFWDHPVNYKELLKKDARKIDLSATIFGLSVTCEETWNNPENHTHYERRYFYNETLVGKSFGYGESRDYADDLDGDGITELICYAREMEGQDYGDVTVFRRIGNSIYMGRLTEYGSFELPNLDTLSATRRITQHYDPETHILYLTYPIEGGDYNSVSFTYEDMKFTEYSYVEPQANNWKEAYANYVRRSEYQAFSLIYLDDDEIPELFCQEGNYPRRIVSLQDGKLVERPLERNSFCYLEKKGIYFTSGGNNGEFPMEIVQLKDGEFVVLASGYQKSEFIASAESTAPDQMMEFVKYDWNGQSVTEEEYNQKIDAIIERRSTAEPKNLYTPDEMLTLLGMEIMSLAVG